MGLRSWPVFLCMPKLACRPATAGGGAHAHAPVHVICPVTACVTLCVQRVDALLLVALPIMLLSSSCCCNIRHPAACIRLLTFRPGVCCRASPAISLTRNCLLTAAGTLPALAAMLQSASRAAASQARGQVLTPQGGGSDQSLAVVDVEVVMSAMFSHADSSCIALQRSEAWWQSTQ